tara:strand:+ start:229 stop:411 length:183 start_codon:yes stop_codon:yes gene_type:complete
MKGNNMSKTIKTNMNYLELMSKINRIQSSLSDLIEDADQLQDKFGRLKRVIDSSIKPEKE